MEKIFYKDRPAVLLTAGDAKMTVLPEDGGKIASLSFGNCEFLEQDPGKIYRRLSYGGDFVKSECASWDDMFPTVDPETVTVGEKEAFLPDHGEIVRVPLAFTEENGTLRLFFASKSLPYTFEKRITATENGFRVSWKIKNTAEAFFPCLWAAHVMLRGAEDLRVSVPMPDSAPVRYVFGEEAAEKPHGRLLKKSADDIPYKYYYTQPLPRGELTVRYEESGEEMHVLFDEKTLPYIGLWHNAGGFQNKYNIAPELATAPYDRPSAAKKAGVNAGLMPLEEKEIVLDLCFSGGRK